MFFLNQNSVQRLIDSFVIQVLHLPQVRLDEMEVSLLGEEADCAVVVQAGGEDGEEIVQEERLVVEVELQSFVVQLHVGNLGEGKE